MKKAAKSKPVKKSVALSEKAEAPPKKNPLDNLKPFQPGQSGNPGGRPKKLLTVLSDALREKLKDVSPDRHRTYAEVLADKLVEEAVAGKLPVLAIREIADRTEGKPAQTVKVDGTITTDGDERRKRITELVAEIAGERDTGSTR